MDITNIFDEQQKQIFKNYLEDTFFESGPGLTIDHEHVWNAVMNTPGFAPEDKQARAEFEESPEIKEFTDRYFTAGRHQRLTSYEGYQEFLAEEVGINIQDRGISEEMQAMMDETNNDYSTYRSPRDAQNAPESDSQNNDSDSSSGTESKSSSEEDPKERITNEMRNQLVNELRQNAKDKGPDVSQEAADAEEAQMKAQRQGLSPEDQRALQNGKKIDAVADSVGAFSAAPIVATGAITNRLTHAVAGVFSSASAGFRKGINDSRDKKAEKTGNFPDAATASRVMNRRMGDIARDNKKLDDMMSALRENPSSQELRAGVVMGSHRLADRISRTSDLAEKAGDLSPNLKQRLSDKLEDNANKVKDRIEDQDIIKTEYFEKLMESINNMFSKVSDLFKKKKGNENEPLAAGPG